MNRFSIHIRLLTAFYLLISNLLHAQPQLLSAADLSRFRTEALSDGQITQLHQELTQRNLSIEEAGALALSRGMPKEELNKLKERLKSSAQFRIKSTQETDRKTTADLQETVVNQKPAVNTGIFGAELYSSPALSFSPGDQALPDPANYYVGISDAFNIYVYGVQEFSWVASVKNDGSISIPNVGLVSVIGLKLSEATERIRQVLKKSVYKTIDNGSSVNISLANIRSINVTVIGAARSGNYTVSSLSSIFHVLYLAGGPGSINSYRQIKLLRDNQLLRTIDMYYFLTTGDKSDNITLAEGDVIMIPPFEARVSLEGELKRPGQYEIVPGKTTLQDLFTLCGGFTESAYRGNVLLNRVTGIDRRLQNIYDTAFANVLLADGDRISVGKILDRIQNKVVVSGSVFRPGTLELTTGMSVSHLLEKSGGLKEDAYVYQATLYREKEDLTKEAIPIYLNKLKSDPGNDLLLRRNDSLRITGLSELRPDYYVDIFGEVGQPDHYVYFEGLSLKTLLLQAGGVTPMAYMPEIEITRRKTAVDPYSMSGALVETRRIAIDSGYLTEAGTDFMLQPGDRVFVKKNPFKAKIRSVYISGEVLYPGTYPLETKNETLSSLVNRAGGLLPTANARGASLSRHARSIIDIKTEETSELAEKISRAEKDSTSRFDKDKARTRVIMDLSAAMLHPRKSPDLLLQEGDSLAVPVKRNTVLVQGEVYNPGEILYDESYSLRDYIDKAAGTLESANQSKIFVIQENGKGEKTRHFLWLFKKYPRIHPGSTIYVPREPVQAKRPLDIAKLVAITGLLSAIATMAIAIAR